MSPEMTLFTVIITSIISHPLSVYSNCNPLQAILKQGAVNIRSVTATQKHMYYVYTVYDLTIGADLK